MQPTILSVPGADLSTFAWQPAGEPRATLQIVHGMSEHAGRYDHVARFFAQAGFAVFAHDHRGHGGSASLEGLGHMGPWEPVLEDVRRVHAEGRRGHEALPHVLLAHSMGSFVGQRLMQTSPDLADAWVLTGSTWTPRALAWVGARLARLERLRVGPERASLPLTALAFFGVRKGFEGRTESDWLTRDAAMVDAFLADPRCGFFLSTTSWIGLLDTLTAVASPAALRSIPGALPLLLVGGEEDRVAGNGKGLRTLEQKLCGAGLADVTRVSIAGARHEVLNETDRDETLATILGWVRARLDALQ